LFFQGSPQLEHVTLARANGPKRPSRKSSAAVGSALEIAAVAASGDAANNVAATTVTVAPDIPDIDTHDTEGFSAAVDMPNDTPSTVSDTMTATVSTTNVSLTDKAMSEAISTAPTSPTAQRGPIVQTAVAAAAAVAVTVDDDMLAPVHSLFFACSEAVVSASDGPATPQAIKAATEISTPFYSSRPSGLTMSPRASPLHATPFYSSSNTQGEQVDGDVIFNPFFAPRELSNAPGPPLASSAAASSPFYLDLPRDVDMSARELSPSPSANVAASAASPFFAHGLGTAPARPEVAASEGVVVEHAQRRSIFFPADTTSGSSATVVGREESATSMPQRRHFLGFWATVGLLQLYFTSWISPHRDRNLVASNSNLIRIVI
jgi:hypothetical protein